MRTLRLREVKCIYVAFIFIYSFDKDVLSVHLCQKFSNFRAYPIPLSYASYPRLCPHLSAGKTEHFGKISGKLGKCLLHEIFYMRVLYLKEEGVQT